MVTHQPAAPDELDRTGRSAAGPQRTHGRPPGESPQHAERRLGHVSRIGQERGEGRRESGRIVGQGPQAEGVRTEGVRKARHGTGLDHQGEPGEPLQTGDDALGLQTEGVGQGGGVLRAEGDNGLGDGEGGGVEAGQGRLHAGTRSGACRERGEGGRRRSDQIGTSGEEPGDVGVGQGGQVSGQLLKGRTGDVGGASAPLTARLVVALPYTCVHSHYSSGPASARHPRSREAMARDGPVRKPPIGCPRPARLLPAVRPMARSPAAHSTPWPPRTAPVTAHE